MKILSVQHAIPSRTVSNDEIIALFHEQNDHRLDQRELGLIDEQIRYYLEMTGTETRHTRESGQKASDFVLAAARNALAAADIAPAQIDFVIYTGVGRGWIEPAMANMIQAELQLHNSTCFDILDACASWLRAMQIAHSFIRSKVYRCGLIVNCECGMLDFANFNIARLSDLEHRFATFTIGEAATATVINDEIPDDDFYFSFKTFSEHYKLCMVPLPNLPDFLPTEVDDRYVPLKFFSLSHELVVTTIRKTIEAYQSDPRLVGGDYNICFGHAASAKGSEIIRRKLRIPYVVYFRTHARYGNTVSASVPLGISLALQEGRLRRGDKTLVIVGSAGISVGFATFTF